MRLLRYLGSRTESIELLGGEQYAVCFEPGGEHGIRLQRFAGLGAIGHPGIEREYAQAGRGIEFRPLVRVHQVAGIGLREQVSTGRENILQAVEHIDLRRALAGVPQLAVAYETEAVTRHPRVAESEAQVVVDFLETELVAERILVKVTANGESCLTLPVERLPELPAAVGQDAQHGSRAGMRCALVDPVHRYIREQGCLGRDPARSEPTGRRNEKPMVPAGYDADEERRHAIHVSYDVVTLSSKGDKFTGNGSPGLVTSAYRMFHILIPYP